MAKRKGTAEIVAARFLSDVANHEMTIVKDDGMHRHIRFQQPKTNHLWFDIVTWPGFLCVSGDMGCYVFSRLSDMFEFFRFGSSPNLSYWGEKVQAVDRQCPVMEYSEDEFRDAVKEAIEQATEDESDSYRKELEREVEEALRYADTTDQRSAISAMMGVVFKGHHPFQDFYEWSCSDYSCRFVWCCHAILWGIQQYDKAKTNEPALTA